MYVYSSFYICSGSEIITTYVSQATRDHTMVHSLCTRVHIKLFLYLLLYLLADVDECADSNGGCTQSCSNSVGSFLCSGLPGYLLDTDGLTRNGMSAGCHVYSYIKSFRNMIIRTYLKTSFLFLTLTLSICCFCLYRLCQMITPLPV